MFSILNARIATGGSFFNSSFNISVVCIGTPDGVLRDRFSYWIPTCLQAVLFPKIVGDDAVSK